MKLAYDSDPRWTRAPLRSFFERVARRGFPEAALLSVYRDHGVVPKASRDDNFNRASEDLSNYLLVEPGDLVVNKMKAWQGSVAVTDYRGIVSPAYFTYRPRRDFDRRFLHFLLRSAPLASIYKFSSNGIRPAQWDLDPMAFKQVTLAVPDLSTQTKIAAYLDRETAQIDALIAKQEQLIATLRERRVATVGRCIPAGFDPMLSSGKSVGSSFKVVLGKMLDGGRATATGEKMLPYLRAANIQDSGLQLGSVNEMMFSPDEAVRLDLRRGDLLVVEGGAVGTNWTLTDDMPGWSFQKTVNRIRSMRDDSTRWLGHVIRTYRDSGYIDLICNGSTIAHLTAEKLRSLRVPDLPPDEQRAITSDIDEQTAQIDALISKAERFIELAKERRAALITAAVTGQLDITAE